MQTQPINVSDLMTAAYLAALNARIDRQGQWITASHRVGSLLPGSLLVVSVQSIGNIDIILLSMESELASRDQQKQADLAMISLNMQRILSEAWVSSAYEITRLLKARKLWPMDERFGSLDYELSLLRMVIDKHEIAMGHRLQEPLDLERRPARPTDQPFQYDKSDSGRSHVMQSGISNQGSFEWLALDANKRKQRWINRQDLSNRLLDLFAQSIPST